MLSAELYEARKKDFLAYKDTLVKEPTEESVKKEYYVGCYNKSDWEFIHEELKKDGSLEDNIPSSSCDVINDCLHSNTRGIYLLNDAEVVSLRNHPKVEYVHINVDAYPGTYLQNPDDLVEHNGGKDIKFGDDKRPVSVVPKQQQVLHDFATGEVLVDEFGNPLLAEADAIFVSDVTAERATSVVFGDTNSVYRRKVFETLPTHPAIYGDYDVSITSSIKNLNVSSPTTTGILTALSQGGDEILCGADGNVVTIDTVSAADASRTAGTYTIGASDYTTDGSGTGATFSIAINESGAATVTIVKGGSGYSVNETFTVQDAQLGGGGGAALTFDVATIIGGRLGIGKTDGTIILHDQWPYLDVRVVEERITDDNGNIIYPSDRKIYFPDHVGITSILNVQLSTSDPLTDKHFLVAGRYLSGNIKVTNVAYNSRLTLAKSHTAGDKIIGVDSTIPISISGDQNTAVVTVTLNNHNFNSGDYLHIKTQAEKSGSSTVIINSKFQKKYKVTKLSDNIFSFTITNTISNLNTYGGRIFIKVPKSQINVSEGFFLEKSNEAITTQSKEFRYTTTVLHQRDHGTDSGETPATIVIGNQSYSYLPKDDPPALSIVPKQLLNRGSWQLRRHQQKKNPWKGVSPQNVKSNKVPQFGTGRDVDVIVYDQDMWFGHIEFQNPGGISNIKNSDNISSTETLGPINYTGGNALRSGFSASATSATNGTCDLLDLVLEAPYYLDPDFFEADPSDRLRVRWDGTKVPRQQVARDWWSDPTKRSAKFCPPGSTTTDGDAGTASGVNDFGTISVPNEYTRGKCNGEIDKYQTGSGYHGTPCASQAYGRQYGWAYNANKWFLCSTVPGFSFTNGFDMQKIFHQIKPTNLRYNNQNPTISSNSWAYRFSKNTGDGGFYYFRPSTTDGTESGVEFTSWDYDGNTDGDTGVAPRFMTNFYENGIRMEPQSGSMLTAGNELVSAGVIFVCSAGNTRQKLVDGNHPDFKNYFSDVDNTAIDASGATFTDPNSLVTYAKTINRPGMPGAIGKSGSGDSTVYNTIQVGALDDDHHITAEFTSGGAGYNVSDGKYSTFPSGGSGSGLIVNLVIASGIVTEIVIHESGSGYTVGDVLTIEGGNPTTAATITITSVNEKEQRANYSNMGNAVDLYAAGDDTLAACDINQSTRYNRYDSYYSIGNLQSQKSEDRVFNGTSSACPVSAGLIATKLETNRTWTYTNIKNWLSKDVGVQKDDNFHTGTEVTTANDIAWGTDPHNLHGGSATVIWDAPSGNENLPSFELNQELYSTQVAFSPIESTTSTGSFSDTFFRGRTKEVFINGGATAGISSVRLQNTTDSNHRKLTTSGKYEYGKQLGLEISDETSSGTRNFTDLTFLLDDGYFYFDKNKPFYTTDNRVNDVRISKSELKEIKSDVILKVAEQFPETSEVSTTLLGVNRAETQLSLFSNVSSYGLESKDWEVIEFRGTISLKDWEERINEIYGQRTRGEITEETQESAIQLYTFPVPNTFPFGPNFIKNGLYNATKEYVESNPDYRGGDNGFFVQYVKFIELGNALYDHYDSIEASKYGGDTQKTAWLSKFLNKSDVSIIEGDSLDDVEYKLGIKDSFAAVDRWTETYRDIIAFKLTSPITGEKVLFTNEPISSLSTTDPYSTTNTRPGYSSTPRRYILLQSRRVFRYQPGRISGFTFGVRAAREFNPGFKLEWGIFNKTDHYVFQIDGGFLKIIRRSKVKLPDYLVGDFSTQGDVISPDPQDSEESEENPTGRDYKLYEYVISQDDFNGDSLDGNGPSGHSVKPQNITMYKIEFGWYGAIGARFYAYIPAGNGEARWVTLHTLVIENKLGEPCLVDPYFRFRYVTNVTSTDSLRTPQFVYKYGASYYIDGGDEGTTTQFSIKTKPDLTEPGVKVSRPTAILGIRPKDQIFNSQGVGTRVLPLGDTLKIINKKIIIPTQLNMSTTKLTKVQVGVCTGCPGWAHVHTVGIRRNGTDNSLPADNVLEEGGIPRMGREMPIKFVSENTITPFVPDGGTQVYFRKEDIGAKIIAPSIYNCYITDVSDQDKYNSYKVATIQGFEGHSEFEFGNTRKFLGERSIDRSVNPPVIVKLPNNNILDENNEGYRVYQSEASKLLGGDATATAQPVRLSNYDGLAISDYKLTGSEIDIQFTIPRGTREGGLDPTWGYTHWGDVLVGVTDKEPKTGGGFGQLPSFAISWTQPPDDEEELNGEPGVGNTTILPNSEILFAEHTHAWAQSDITGADAREAWPIFQFRSRLGLTYRIPSLTGISTGRCGRVKITVDEPQRITGITYVTTLAGVTDEGPFLVSASGQLSSIGKDSYVGGQVAYFPDPTNFDTPPIVSDEQFKGNVTAFTQTIGDQDVQREYLEIGDIGLDDNSNIDLAIRPVNISTEFSRQKNNKTKLFKYDVFPLYPVIKLKDYGEINNISIKEKIGETETTVAPKFLVNGCEVNKYADSDGNFLAENNSTPPTNFTSVDDLSGAEFDNQNKSRIREFVEKDVFFVGENQTTSIDMSKVFSQDKEVINADSNNVEATFVIVDQVDRQPGETVTVQASVNFKEQ